ncbi:MAG: hypothetical protein QXQ69_00615 [Candidatus Aenigmatarchaeota archaeon]
MRSFEEIKKDLDYVRNWESLISSLLAGNIAYSLFREFLEGRSEAQEKIRSLTLDYLGKISELRKEYEKEMEKLLRGYKEGKKME